MEFKDYFLGDIADIQISGVDKKTVEGETSVRLCNFVDVYRNWAITKNMYPNLMEATARQNEIDTFKIHKGQVAITKDSETRDDIGIATYIADNFEETVLLGYHTALITPDQSVLNAKYLNALLHSKYFHDYWYNNASGSGMRYTLSDLCIKKAVVKLPPIEAQEEIGNILSTLDRKIALNRRMNATLEAMAKKLYDYWFVQFDFPNAEGKPYKSSGGKMVWNEKIKREIPEGWEVKTLGSLLTLSENGEWGNEEQTGNDLDVHCIRGADIIDLVGAPKRYLPNNKQGKLLLKDDIIIEISGGSPTQATGRSNYVTEEILKMYKNNLTCSNFCKFVRLEDVNYAPFFFYTWSLIYDNGNMFHYEGKTSGIKNLQIDSLLKEHWQIPPYELIAKFYKQVSLNNSKIGKNKHEIERLTSLRDTLLPLLMNGQVTIKD